MPKRLSCTGLRAAAILMAYVKLLDSINHSILIPHFLQGMLERSLYMGLGAAVFFTAYEKLLDKDAKEMRQAKANPKKGRR